ncbi:MAG: hypothetical protein [CRESS virus sp. ctpVY4]|nr:MAG: hypothetical protein [CRESS virus sp. ctpVY4]
MECSTSTPGTSTQNTPCLTTGKTGPNSTYSSNSSEHSKSSTSPTSTDARPESDGESHASSSPTTYLHSTAHTEPGAMQTPSWWFSELENIFSE